MNDIIKHICTPSRPCRRHRTCYRCGKKHQARVADAAERLKNRVGTLRWHILYPDQPGAAACQRMRENWLKRCNGAGAIWTIEKSSTDGRYHINILTAAEIQHAPSTGHFWSQIVIGNPRHIGAYISKNRQAPTSENYSGRLYGTSGTIWQWLSSGDADPIVQAAATQYALDSHKMLSAAPALEVQAADTAMLAALTEVERHKALYDRYRARTVSGAALTTSEARAIAARWLPDLLEIKTKIAANCDKHKKPPDG